MKRLLASSIAAVALLTACGVAEDTTAATVGDHDISTQAVADLAKSDLIKGSLQQSGASLVSSTSATTGSESQRLALTYLIATEVFERDVADHGGEVTSDDTDAAEQQIASDEQNGATYGAEDRKLLVRLRAAQAASLRLLEVTAPEVTDAEVEAYFEANADQFADLTCFDGLAVEPTQAAAVQAALDDGGTVDDILANAAFGAQPFQQGGGQICAPTGQVQEPTLAALIDDSPVGRWSSAEVDNGGATFTVFVRPESRGDVGPDNATVAEQVRQQLQQEADTAAQTKASEGQQELIAKADVDIDPRYGSWDPTAPSLILAPPTPKLSAKASAGGGLSADDLTAIQGQ